MQAATVDARYLVGERPRARDRRDADPMGNPALTRPSGTLNGPGARNAEN
jgi:hypothetical protein